MMLFKRALEELQSRHHFAQALRHYLARYAQQTWERHMRAEYVTDTIGVSQAMSGSDWAVMRHKPSLLGDNGPCYISTDLAD